MIKLCDEAEKHYRRVERVQAIKPSWVAATRNQSCKKIATRINFKCRYDYSCYRTPKKKEDKIDDKKSKDV